MGDNTVKNSYVGLAAV